MKFRIRGGSTGALTMRGEFEIKLGANEMASFMADLVESALKQHTLAIEENMKRTQPPQSILENKRFLSVRETARYLGISPQTIYNSISLHSGKAFAVKPKRVGRRVLFDIKQLNEYLDSL
jgi:excisionase family DNA binding protein